MIYFYCFDFLLILQSGEEVVKEKKNWIKPITTIILIVLILVFLCLIVTSELLPKNKRFFFALFGICLFLLGWLNNVPIVVFFKDQKNRWKILFGTGIVVLFGLIFFKPVSECLDIVDWIRKYLKWIPLTLIVGIVAAPFAFFMWFWKDQNKRKDQDHVEKELERKENNDAWENFRKYQEIVEWKENEHGFKITDAQKTSAIYALKDYYKRQGANFPEQVHEFFKEVLNNYWNQDVEFQKYYRFEKIVNSFEQYIKMETAETEEKEQSILSELKQKIKSFECHITCHDIELQKMIDGVKKINVGYKFKHNSEDLIEHTNWLKEKLQILLRQTKEKKIKRYIQAIYDVLKQISDETCNNISDETCNNNVKMFNKKNLSLSGFKFINTNIKEIYLESANLSHAYFMNVSLFDSFNRQTFEKIDFSNAIFNDMKFYNKTFKSTKFRDVEMERIEIFDCNFSESNIVNLSIEKSFIANSNFSENYDNGGPIYIKNSKIQNSTFEKNNMTQSSFINIKYLDISFNDSILEKCYFNIFPKLTDSSHLRQMMLKFINTNLAGSFFNNSKLEKVNFQNSKLWATSFKKAKIINCNFKDALYVIKPENLDEFFIKKDLLNQPSNNIFSGFMIDTEVLDMAMLLGVYKNLVIYDKIYLQCPKNTKFPSDFSIPQEDMTEFYEYILSVKKDL